MRNAVLFVLLHLTFQTLSGQTFYPVPGPLLEQEISPGKSAECYLFLNNPSGDSLLLRWKTIEKSVPAEWILDLCDFGLCYVGVPPGGLMNPAAGADQPYLKLIAQPENTPGDAWLWFRIWEDGNPDNSADVFFSLYTPGVTSTDEAHSVLVRVFPNPTSDKLFLENTGLHPVETELFDATGRMVWQGLIGQQTRQEIDLSAWPAGMYFLKMAGRTMIVQRAR